MRRRSSNSKKRRHQVRVLRADVMTPRIAWCNALRYGKFAGKLLIGLAVCFALAFGVREAIQRTFHENPDFRLQNIILNPNNVFNEESLVSFLSIDLSDNIFNFDVDHLSERLGRHPAILTATVQRRLPGTLDFHITPRKPVAWLTTQIENRQEIRKFGASLISEKGFVYPCPSGQIPYATTLPILVINDASGEILNNEGFIKHSSYRDYFSLLTLFKKDFPNDLAEIDTFSQENPWSIKVTTRSGTTATFGLRNHKSQLERLRHALHHAHQKGYRIQTINLIPQRNIPITIAGEGPPPRAIPVLEDPTLDQQANHTEDDIRNILNRN